MSKVEANKDPQRFSEAWNVDNLHYTEDCNGQAPFLYT